MGRGRERRIGLQKMKRNDVKMCSGSNNKLMLNPAFVWHNTVTTATVPSTIITHIHTCRRDLSAH